MESRVYLVVATLLIVGVDGARGGRIIPYKAVIEYKGTAFCVGTVIDAVWILTAAQCVMNTTVSYLTIRLGSSNTLPDSGTLFSVKAFHVHPKYDPVTSQRDIALLRLSSVAKLGTSGSPINVIPLVKPGYGMEEGTRCSIPASASPGPGASEGVKAKLWSRERCQAAVPKSIQLTDDALCAKITPSNASSGQQFAVSVPDGGRKKWCGDHHQQQQQLQPLQQPPSRFMPGSPLVCEGKQVAVVRQRSTTAAAAAAAAASATAGHCNDERDLPDFFTDVAFADQWISSHTTARRKRKPGGSGGGGGGKRGKPMAKLRRKLHSRNGGASGRVRGGAFLVVILVVFCGAFL